MTVLTNAIRQFRRNECGAAIVEYGIALLVVAGIAVSALTYLGTTTNANVQTGCAALGSATC